MDTAGIKENINKIDNKADLAAHKTKVLGQLTDQLTGLGIQAAQLAGLTNPATFIASMISMLTPLATTVSNQISDNESAASELTTAFADKKATLRS
jgi:hypothetical protein